MRRVLLAMITMIAAAMLTTPALAQSALGSKLSDYGGFLGLDLRFGDAADKFGAFAGGEAAALLKHRVYLGLRGAGLVTDNIAVPLPGAGRTADLHMGYGGFVIGYTIPAASLVDISIDALVGGGAAGIDEVGEDSEWDPVFVFEPSATLDLKLTRFVRIGFGAAYRFVGDVEVEGVEESNLRGVTGLIRIRAGRF